MKVLLGRLLSEVFIFVIAGIIIDRIARGRGERFVSVLIEIALFALIPVFVLYSMWATPLELNSAGTMVLAAIAVTGTGTGLALAWCRMRKLSFRDYCLPVIFMNSAYLAIPVNTLLWGPAGAAFSIVYNAVMTFLTFTAGIRFVSRSKAGIDPVQIPMLAALALGALLNILAVPVPAPAVVAGRIVTAVTLPLMLMIVGYRLGGIGAGALKPAFAGVALRMGGGFLSAFLLVRLLGITGAAAGVVVMSSAMPPAVMSTILIERFGGDRQFSSAAVFLGTAASAVVIPLIACIYR